MANASFVLITIEFLNVSGDASLTLKTRRQAVLSEVDADTTGFRSFLTGAAGRIEHDGIRESAEAAGVFGVPSFIVDGDFFGDVSTWPNMEKLAPLARSNRLHPAWSAS